jgi:hypothetical protein
MKKAAVPSILVAVVLLALGVIAEAQQPTKVPRIGYLGGLGPPRCLPPGYARAWVWGGYHYLVQCSD